MATGIFKGPKGALIFMGATMASVALLVGTEDNGGALVEAADEISRSSSPDGSRRDVSRLPQPAQRVVRRQVRPSSDQDSTSFADDADLIDDTSGFDPTPSIPQPFDTGPSDAQAFDTRPAPQSVSVVESSGEIIVN